MSDDTLDTTGAVQDYLKGPDFLGGPDPATQARVSVASAVGTNSDLEAELRRVAQRTGVPMSSARAMPEDVKRRATLADLDFDDMAQRLPSTVAFLAEKDNALVAHDDIENMGLVESTLNSFKRGWRGLKQLGPTLTLANQGGALANIDEIDKQLAAGKKPEEIASSQLGPLANMYAYMTLEERAAFRRNVVPTMPSTVSKAAARVAELQAEKQAIPAKPVAQEFSGAKTWGEAFKALARNPLDILATIGPESLVQSAPGIAAAIPATIIAGPAGGAATIGANSFAVDYAATVQSVLQESGVDLNDAAAVQKAMQDPAILAKTLDQASKHAGVVAAVDAVSGGLASKVLLPASVLAKKPVARAAASVGVQTATQGVLGAAGEAGGELAAGQELQPGQILAEAVGEVVSTPGEVAGMSAERVREAAKQRADLRQKVVESTQDAQSLQALVQTAAKSKLMTRDPQALADFVQKVADKGDAPSEVFVDAKAFAEALNQNGITVEQAFAAMPSIERQFAEAAASGGDIAIPIGEFTAGVAGSPIEQALMQHVRTDPEALSQAEATQLMKGQAEALNADAARIIAEQGAESEAAKSAAAVRGAIYDQLQTAGRFKPDVNAAYADMVRDFYTVQAQRLGLTPEELFKKHPLTIKAEGLFAPNEALNQGDGFRTESRGYLSGQTDHTLTLREGGREVGAVDYSVYGGKPAIQMIRVPESERRKGYGRRLVQRLQTEFPGTEIEWGGLTDDGAALKNSLKFREVPVPEVQEQQRRLQNAIAERRALEQRAERGEPLTAANLDHWNELHDLIGTLEREVGDAPAVIRLIEPDPLKQDDPGAAALQLGKIDGLFQHPKSAATDMVAMAAEKNPDLRIERETITQPDGSEKPTGNWNIRTPSGDDAIVTERDGKVWINVAGLAPGGGGSLIYDLVANYALNNGLKFIGDPAGLSNAAMVRRTENMLSSAIKYGTTDHLEPHPKQLQGNDTIPALKWKDGDTAANVRSMMEAVVAANAKLSPAGSGVDYDATTGQFKDSEGVTLDADGLADLSDLGRGTAGAGAPGRATLQRAALFRALLSGPDGQRGVLESLRRVPSDGSPGAGEGSFYQAVDQTQTPEFKAWFGDSKVVDENGKPLVVYHGRGADFGEFNTAGAGKTAGSGAFFTSSPAVADTYATGDAPNVAPAYLSLRNPVIVHAKGANWARLGKGVRVELPAVEVSDQADEDLLAELEGREPRAGATKKLKAKKTTLKQLFPGELVYGDDFASTDDLARWAKKQGYDGIIFRGVVDHGPSGRFSTDEARKPADLLVVFKPTQIKSAIGNRGTFDPNNPSILNQDTDPRGTFAPSTSTITLLAKADLSTFLHETGHFYLETLAAMASAPDAPAEIAQDMQTVLGWFGFEGTAADWLTQDVNARRDAHEKFARGFEAYLFEGKAPSTELTRLFGRFRAWLTHIYKSIRALDVEINDDIRSVFDRLLASEQQIKEVEAARAYAPLFADEKALKEAGVDPAAYHALGAEATEAAVTDLQRRSLRDMQWLSNAKGRALKALQREAKEKRKVIEAQVREEVNAMPEYRAADLIAESDKEFADDPFGADPGLRRGAIADALGFPSVDTMVRAIEDAPPRAEVIEGMTDQRMLEEHGELSSPEALQRAAEEAIHNEVRGKFIATELSALNKALGPARVLVAAAKQFAEAVIGRKQITDIKPHLFVAAETRAAKQAEKSLGKSTDEAAIAKRNQLLNHYAARYARDALSEIDRIREFFKKVADTPDDRLKSRDMDVVNAARAVLAAYGVGRKGEAAAEYLKRVAAYDPEMSGVLQDSVDAALASAKPLAELTLDELRAINDEVASLWHLAKRSRQMEIDGDLLDREEVQEDLKARLVEIGIPDRIAGEGSAVTPAEQRLAKLKTYLASARRTESWVGAMDGANTGVFRRYIWQPVKEAADAYRTDRAKLLKQYRELLDTIAPTMRKRIIDAPELGYTFGKDTGGVALNEILHAILHTGNSSNKKKLLLGRKWATENADGSIDTSRWDAFVNRMAAEGVLTKAHFDFVQGVWNLLESTKPLAQKTHRDVFGKYFAEVTAEPVATPFGQYAGGYAPAVADPRVVSDAQTRKLMEDENASMAFAFPATNRGFTKGRVEYNRPLTLDLGTLAQHIDKVLLFSHMERPIRDVRRVLTAKGVAYGVNRIDPAAFDAIISPWLNRAARQQVTTPSPGHWQSWRLWSTLRNRAGMAAMFGNVVNAAQQITGFSIAAVKVRPKYLLGAMAHYVTNPRQLAADVAAASPYMEGRISNEIAAMNDAIKDILIDPSLYERTQQWTMRHAYFLQSAVDNVMSPIIWIAARNQALEQGQSEKEAGRFADATVRQTQGSTLPEDISNWEGGSSFSRMFSQFAGYFNMQANLLGTEFQTIARDMGLRNGAGRGLYVLVLAALAPAWVSELIVQAFRGGPDDEDKDGEYLDDWLQAVFGMATLRGLTAMIPIFGQGANAVVNAANSKPYDDRLATSPAVSMVEGAVRAPVDVYKAAFEDGDKSRAVKDVASLISLLTGIPANIAARPLSYAVDVQEGDVNPTGPADAARGLVTGRASPGSK